MKLAKDNQPEQAYLATGFKLNKIKNITYQTNHSGGGDDRGAGGGAVQVVEGGNTSPTGELNSTQNLYTRASEKMLRGSSSSLDWLGKLGESSSCQGKPVTGD